MKLGFGQIEAALREMHGVDPSKERSFRARLRYLQQRVDIGIPRAGVGRRANFTVGHALLFAIALELEQFGMTPERVAEMVKSFGLQVATGTLREAVFEAADRIGTKRPAALVSFYPVSLSEAVQATGDPADLAASTITWSDADGLPPALFRADGRLSRLAIMNLSAVVTDLIEHLDGEPENIRDALIAWANDEEGE